VTLVGMVNARWVIYTSRPGALFALRASASKFAPGEVNFTGVLVEGLPAGGFEGALTGAFTGALAARANCNDNFNQWGRVD
jgi:hypothetical protein